MAKSPCPISKTQFLDKAEPVKITIGTSELVADKREFSTGSFGWYYNGKTTITVDGKLLSVQIGLNLTVVGSREAARYRGRRRCRRAGARLAAPVERSCKAGWAGAVARRRGSHRSFHGRQNRSRACAFRVQGRSRGIKLYGRLS